MSLQKIQNFLKEHQQDILEFWVEGRYVNYIRTINRNNGLIIMIKVIGYKISSEEEMGGKTFLLEKIEQGYEDYSDKLILLYDTFIKIFPENKQHFLLQMSNYLIDDRDNIYRILNFTSSHYQTVHWIINLEWFYDNLNMVEHEVNRLHVTICKKTEQMYEKFIENYVNFMNKPENDVHIVQRVWHRYKEQNTIFMNGKKLYLDIAKLENNIKREYLEMDSFHTTTSFNFNESLRKSHEKKELRKKLNNLMQIRHKAMKELNIHWNLSYHILLEFLFFITEITVILSRFHTLFVELENMIPPSIKE